MWDSYFTNPFGRISRRNLLITLILLIVTLLSSILMTAQPSAAADDGAIWNGQSKINYDSNTYSGPVTGADIPSVVPKTAVAVYIYSDDSGTAKILYFPEGSDLTKAGSVEYLTAKYSSDTGKYSNPSPPKKVTIDSQPAANQSDNGSCNTSGSLGWIVCPVSSHLAHGVDTLYNIVANFLQVQPLSSSQSSVIYEGWKYMRNLANVSFIIAFLIIIYSQITGAGMSSYGLKKLLPRLLIAAVLMNISYWVCAIGVDLSNFFGVSLENFFMNLRDGLMTGKSLQVQLPTWGEVTAAILGLGALSWAGAAIVISSGGVLALLVPLLVGAALSALVAIVILAARQAILVILIIISPLAFVAFLLPNTEKYFKKWSDTYMTLLVMFPIFSVLFGGAQLAGGAIILTSHSIVELLFGMAIQVVPLAVTPFLIKLSTSGLSQVAGFINNPKKGVVDRTRNWSKQKNEDMRDRGLKYNRFARAVDHRKRAKEDRRKSIKSRNDTLYHKSARYEAIDKTNRAIDREQKRIEAGHEIEWNVILKTDRRQFEKEMNMRTTVTQSEAAKGRIDKAYEELKSGQLPSDLYPAPFYRRDGSMLRVRDRATDATRDIALTGMSKNMAGRLQQQQLAEDLKANTDMIDGQSLREYAGGIMGRSGELSVQSNAKKTVSGQTLEDIKNITDTMDYDLARDNKRLYAEFNKPDNTTAQRVAYAQIMANNGTDGVRQFRKIMHEYGDNPSIPADELRDFKELVSTDSGILNQGKDIKVFLKQSRDASGNLRSFEDLSNDSGTWTSQSPEAFATQNQATQEHALRTLLSQGKNKEYDAIIRGIRSTPSAIGRVNDGVRREFSIYSDAEIKSDSTLPSPGTHRP